MLKSPPIKNIKTRLQKFYAALPAPPSTNFAFRKLPNPYALLPENAAIFDIGSKDSKGIYAFGTPPATSVVTCVDIEPGPGVDIVADAHDMHPIPSNTADCVVLISTLQHVKYPYKVVAEIHRILRPGGIFYTSVPFIFPFHSDPYDFHRFTVDGLAVLCEEFEPIDTGFNRGPAATMTPLLIQFFAILFSFNSSALHTANTYVLTWLLFWIKYLDIILGRFKSAKVIHAGSYFLGRKPNSD